MTGMSSVVFNLVILINFATGLKFQILTVSVQTFL